MCNKCDNLILARDEFDKFVKAAELPWAEEYTKDGEHFDTLLKKSAKLERNLKKYFKELKGIASKLTWDKYEVKESADKKRDFTVDIDFEDDGYDDTFMKFVVEPVTDISLAGMMALESTAPVKVPTADLSTKIADSTAKYCGKLITKINETTRDKINSAISQSMQAGLTKDQAADVVNAIIDDPYRAEMIAHTESVQAYSRGREEYAKESGATGKIWNTQSGNPCEDCQSCEDDGQVGINDSFGPGWDSPDDSHPNCYCYVEYVYDEV